MKMTRLTHRYLWLQNIIFYLLLFAVVGLLGYFSQQFVFHADWTKGNRNSLAQPTQELVKTLQGPIKFMAFVPDSKELHSQIKRLVGKYQQVKPDVELELINPDLDPQRAQQEGVRHAGQMVLHFNGKSELLNSTGEQAVANALLRMSRGAERLVIFLEGHEERDALSQQSDGYGRLINALQRNGFRIQPHNLLRSQVIPDNTRFLVIAAPKKELLAGEVELINSYVAYGGNLLWLKDPGEMQGLQPLADQLAVRFADGNVVDANEELRKLLGVPNPAIVPVVDYGSSAIGANLTGLRSLFPYATMVEQHPLPAANAPIWKTEEFLSTLPNSWLETSTIQGSVAYDSTAGDVLGPIPIGLTLTRALDQPKESGANSEPVDAAQEHQQRVVVIGDSDFLSNSFIGQGVNLDLATNLFNWLSADDNLLKVRVAVPPDMEFNMPNTSLIVLAVFFLFVLPLALLLSGIVIWLRRKRR